MRKHVERIERSIEYLFYALFAITPLAMHPFTSELFELNKMWFVWIFSLIILFLWGSKMIILKKFELRRTFFDIPLVLFLLSQTISTFISLDPHTSFWGYYSRFNGGLLSTISYIFLYYAFATNVLSEDHETSVQKVYNTLTAILLSAFLVTIWGLPSHFGYDPTCLVFRGSFDVSCWTDQFQPKVRMFSTLGQPNWLGTFLAIIIPINVALIISWIKKIQTNELFTLPFYIASSLTVLNIMMYLALTWTLSQSSLLGFWVGNLFFVVLFLILLLRKNSFSFLNTVKQKILIAFIFLNFLYALISFLTVLPIPALDQYTLKSIMAKSANSNSSKAPKIETHDVTGVIPVAEPNPLDASITRSSDIRKIVWKGAIDIWKAYPLFGSGVETFAWAYYKYRPIEHNLTTEWDYLYNKAHNEFLNYLATTGAFGFLTYLAFIFGFLYYALLTIFRQLKNGILGNPLLPAFVGSFIVIQVSNFFGFSVVNVNLLMFFIPLFFFALKEKEAKILTIPTRANNSVTPSEIFPGQIMGMLIIAAFSTMSIFMLINFWYADIDYGWGSNYQRINEFKLANDNLEKAVAKRPGEDLFNNELSVNLAAIALNFAEQKDQQNTALFGSRSKELSDNVAKRNPNNVVYWKSRTRVLFSLAQINPTFLPEAITAIETAGKLAPTDAKIIYNKALIYDQAGQHDKAFNEINRAIKLKPNYRDAYYAKALFYKGMIDVEKSQTKIIEYKKQAREALEFTLKNINPEDSMSKELLKSF